MIKYIKERWIVYLLVLLSIFQIAFLMRSGQVEYSVKEHKIETENSFSGVSEGMKKLDNSIKELEGEVKELQEVNDELGYKIGETRKMVLGVYKTTGKLLLDTIPIEEKLYMNSELTPETIKSTNVYLGEPSYYTAKELNLFLLGTSMSGMGSTFVEAEIRYGVNSAVLMSIAIHESGWGNSQIALLKNNLFGFKAYDDSPFASAEDFETSRKGIMLVARNLKKEYILESGSYYRNNASLYDMNYYYASDKLWSFKITNTLKKFMESVEERN